MNGMCDFMKEVPQRAKTAGPFIAGFSASGGEKRVVRPPACGFCPSSPKQPGQRAPQCSGSLSPTPRSFRAVLARLSHEGGRGAPRERPLSARSAEARRGSRWAAGQGWGRRERGSPVRTSSAPDKPRPRRAADGVRGSSPGMGGPWCFRRAPALSQSHRSSWKGYRPGRSPWAVLAQARPALEPSGTSHCLYMKVQFPRKVLPAPRPPFSAFLPAPPLTWSQGPSPFPQPAE